MKNYRLLVKIICFPIIFALLLSISGCNSTTASTPIYKKYKFKKSVEVSGRQGIAVSKDFYYVSGSTSLTKYDKDWNVVLQNTKPFSYGYEKAVNHIGDIDVYENEIYCGVELFIDGKASNIQIAVYDGDSLTLTRSFNFEPKSGQTECSGICVDSQNRLVWMSSWGDDETGRYLYKYDLESGKYMGKIHLHPIPQWIQGVVCFDGALYVAADDGNADDNEPDHVYKVILDENGTSGTVTDELALYDVIKQGEIEGLSFDSDNKKLYVLYNRGARIIMGMPSGFYEGYDHEISEVYEYSF